MPIVVHNAIVVTAEGGGPLINDVVSKARQLGLRVSDVITSQVGEYKSVLIGPDGAGETRAASREWDAARGEFKEWLLREGPKDWVEIRYGGDSIRPAVADASAIRRDDF